MIRHVAKNEIMSGLFYSLGNVHHKRAEPGCVPAIRKPSPKVPGHLSLITAVGRMWCRSRSCQLGN